MSKKSPPQTTQAIREAFTHYFTEHGHVAVPGSSLVPQNDHSLLFTNAGMVPFKEIFLGLAEPPYPQAVTLQRCLRAGGKHNDLENVGYTARHHTFFEMLGNFSFGSYSKKTAIEYAWTFLTEELCLPKERLWVTVFEKDDESARIWLEDIGLHPNHLSRCGEEDNFWSMGDTGPCGPCTEIFYDHADDLSQLTTIDDDRRVEIWNIVFMEYNRQSDGRLSRLPQLSVDTGMGLERIAAVMQKVKSNYDTDVFKTIMAEVAKQCKVKDLNSASLRVIADHIRSICFLILDGVLPSNEGRGYVLRRIIRRAARHGYTLGACGPFLYSLVSVVVQTMGTAYPALASSQSAIQSTLLLEEQAFSKTLEKGLVLLEQALPDCADRTVSGELAFLLYDTYGFPLDLTADIAREKGYKLDQAGFDQAMAKQRDQSRANTRFESDYARFPSLSVASTQFRGYEQLATDGTVLALLDEHYHSVDSLTPAQKGWVVLDQTPFYAEAGGQVGDSGDLTVHTSDSGCVASFKVEDTVQQSGLYFHQGLYLSDTKTARLKVGDRVEAKVNHPTRQRIACNHTATHLLHAALRHHLGDSVVQQGSLVDSDRLRFDFSYAKPLTREQIQSLETLINQKIRDNLEGVIQLMTLDDAKALGAIALFDDKYQAQVRVLRIGDFSIELCGGTHVKRTGEIGSFKIISETGIAAGVRRIEAITGEAVVHWMAQCEASMAKAASYLKVSPAHWLDKLKQTVEQLQAFEKQCKVLQDELITHVSRVLNRDAGTCVGDEIYLIAQAIPGLDAQGLRQIIDDLKPSYKKLLIILATVKDGRVTLVSGATPAACSDRLNANLLLNHVAAQVGGKGGGRPEMAQGGGTAPEKLGLALATLEDWINQINNNKEESAQ